LNPARRYIVAVDFLNAASAQRRAANQDRAHDKTAREEFSLHLSFSQVLVETVRLREAHWFVRDSSLRAAPLFV
jgi:hypothetical protein